MTYLIAAPHKVLGLFVGPLLPRPLLGEVDQLVDHLLLAFFAVWCPARVPVPNNCGSNVSAKP